MGTLIRTMATSLVALAIGAALVSCSSVSHRPAAQVPNCSQLLAAAVNHVRTAAGDINAIMQTLTENCSDEYEIAVDYVANSAESEFRIDSCDELLRYGMRNEAVPSSRRTAPARSMRRRRLPRARAHSSQRRRPLLSGPREASAGTSLATASERCSVCAAR